MADKIKQAEIMTDTRDNDGTADDYPGKKQDWNAPWWATLQVWRNYTESMVSLRINFKSFQLSLGPDRSRTEESLSRYSLAVQSVDVIWPC